MMRLDFDPAPRVDPLTRFAAALLLVMGAALPFAMALAVLALNGF